MSNNEAAIVIETPRGSSKTQIKRGIVIIAIFVLLRALLAKLWEVYFGFSYESSLQFILFLFSSFLVMSVGLVYFGFTRWVGVDLKKWWWYDRKRILGDIGWGILGSVILLVSTMVMAIGITTMLALTPTETPTISPIQFLLSLFFGFAVAAFTEETIFRGFLQNILKERFGNWQSNILQAAAFSMAHIGYYTLNEWYMFIVAFVGGIVFGWLKNKRGSLLAPAIAHGLLG